MVLKYSIFAVVVGLLLVFVVGCKFTRHGYESPDYSVVRNNGSFEIRDYPDLPLVTTSMNPDNPSDGDSFMRLFRYISGANENEQKISMTVPVFTSRNVGAGEMSFLLPQNVAHNGAPDADSQSVELDTMQGGRFATYRFSGTWNMERQNEAKSTLFEWLNSESIVPVGDAIVASYDPPFTPPFMRRNEILVRIRTEEN